jgi:hypothetical protein
MNMKRNRMLLLVIAFLVLSVGVMFWLRSRGTNQHLLRLRIVRRTEDQGKPVVFFRVEGANNRRLVIDDVIKVSGNTTEEPFFHDTLGVLQPAHEFWGPSQTLPIGDSNESRKEFAVLAPTTAPVWTLKVRVTMFERSHSRSFMLLARQWRTPPKYLFKEALDLWDTFYLAGTEYLESDTITPQP